MVTIPKETPWVALNAAAKALGQTRYTVLVRCVAGELKARSVNGQVLVSRASIERARVPDEISAPAAGAA